MTLEESIQMMENLHNTTKRIQEITGDFDISKLIPQMRPQPVMPEVSTVMFEQITSMPPSILALQNIIAQIRTIKGNHLPIYHNHTPIYRAFVKQLDYLNNLNASDYQTARKVLEDQAPELCLRFDNALIDLEDIAAINDAVARKQYINILTAIGADVAAFIDSLDRPAEAQLLYTIIFVITSLILYLQSTPEALEESKDK